MTKQQSGFTLIELVLVIVILGILAATALPRFSDLSREARLSALNGLAGGVRSGAAIAHATQLAKGWSSNSTNTIEGQSIVFVNGYPDATTIDLMITDRSGFTFVGGVWTSQASCTATYTAAPASGAFPSVLLATSGC